MTRRWVAATASAVLLFAGCASGAAVQTSAGPTATAIPAAGSTLDAAGFAAALKVPGTVLLDVRTPAEFASGHLPGAINLDFEAADFATAAAALDPGKTYALYCRSGNRSGQAMAQLRTAGFTSLYHLGGGIGAWTAAGGDTVR